MNRMGRERDYGTIARWVTVAVALVLVVFVAVGLLRFGGRTTDLSTTSVERAIRSSLMQCFALEGAYPADLSYLEANYGLILDRARYVFTYEVVGANIEPIVKVELR